MRSRNGTVNWQVGQDILRNTSKMLLSAASPAKEADPPSRRSRRKSGAVSPGSSSRNVLWRRIIRVYRKRHTLCLRRKNHGVPCRVADPDFAHAVERHTLRHHNRITFQAFADIFE